METFDIAKLKVQFDARGELLHARTRAYLCVPTDTPDMVLDLPESFFEQKHKAFPQLSLDECRYVWTGEAFYARLLQFSGLLMHASCVNVQAPIRALVFLERGAENNIKPIPAVRAIPLFLSQTLRPPQKEKMAQMLDLLGELLESVPTFLLTCNMDISAAHTAFDGIESYYQEKAKENEAQK